MEKQRWRSYDATALVPVCTVLKIKILPPGELGSFVTTYSTGLAVSCGRAQTNRDLRPRGQVSLLFGSVPVYCSHALLVLCVRVKPPVFLKGTAA